MTKRCLEFDLSPTFIFVAGVPESFTQIALGRIWGVPNSVLLTAGLVTVLWILVDRTPVGQTFKRSAQIRWPRGYAALGKISSPDNAFRRRKSSE